jgi:hypothetical protein
MPARFSSCASRIRPFSVGAAGASALPARRITSALNHAPNVSGRWKLNSRQGGPHLLRLHHAHQLVAQEQAVIGLTPGGGQLPHGNTRPCAQVEVATVLHRPAGRLQQGIDPAPGLGFGLQGSFGHSRRMW